MSRSLHVDYFERVEYKMYISDQGEGIKAVLASWLSKLVVRCARACASAYAEGRSTKGGCVTGSYSRAWREAVVAVSWVRRIEDRHGLHVVWTEAMNCHL